MFSILILHVTSAGTLHFVNIDESDTRDYACTVQNYVLRTFAQGDDKIIDVKPSQGKEEPM